jgi:electron transfer flavoprotein alpha subunit
MGKNSKNIETAEIITDQCIGCQICLAECPVGAIDMVDGAAHIDPELCIGCGKCQDVCPVSAVRFDREAAIPAGAIKEKKGAEPSSAYRGVAVFIELREGVAADVSWELVGKARELAVRRDAPVIGFLLGSHVADAAREAVAYGCDHVHVIDDPLLTRYASKTFGEALTTLCLNVKPEILLIGATALGRDLAGVVATTLRTGLTADCTALDIHDDTGVLLMTRPTFGGNIMATIFCEHHRPQMSTVRPKVMKMPLKEPGRTGTIHEGTWNPPTDAIPELVKFIQEVAEAGSIDVTKVPALVAAGKGACDPSTMPMLEELAELLGGAVVCSRPVVEAGLMPYERQVGQTGKTVAPKLYVAVGVSGAIQHLVGMQGAEKVIAINADPHAPIFKVADVGLVGDYKRLVPVFIEELRKRIAKESKGQNEDG